MLNPWFFLAVSCMAINWLAVWFGWRTANFISKPCIILALLGWFFSIVGFSFPALWFGIGLIFALLGDTLLMFKGKSFLFGMAAFMGTHIAYSLGFNQGSSQMDAPHLRNSNDRFFIMDAGLYDPPKRRADEPGIPQNGNSLDHL